MTLKYVSDKNSISVVKKKSWNRIKNAVKGDVKDFFSTIKYIFQFSANREI